MSEGMAVIEFPFGVMCLKFDVHVASADAPILLGLPHMDLLGIYFNNLDDRLVHPESGHSITTIRLVGHAFVQRNPHIKCHFTNIELCRLRRHFGYPSTDKPYHLLECVDVDSINDDAR